MKKWIPYIAIGVVACLYIWIAVFGNDPLQTSISSKILRFHVLANSDSTMDQSVKEKVKDSSILSFPPLSINLIEHKAYWNEEEIPLSNREFDLLHLLSTKPGEAFSFQEIGKKAWGSFLESDRRAIMVNISRLRKKLDLYEGLEDIIESVWSKGYRLLPKNKY